MNSDELSTTYEVDFVLAKTPTVPLFENVPLSPERKDTPVPDNETVAESAPQMQLKSINAAVSALDEAEVKSWSPPDVVRWMQEAGFDDSVVEKFFTNDISGAILLELQSEDLKELDIRSFGKRRNLMNSIQHLRDSIMLPQSPITGTRDQASPDCQTSSDSASTTTRESGKSKKHRRRRHHRSHKKEPDSTKDDDAASIVAIEQILPKPHRCSKGEECRKWQKQQRKIARLAKDLPIDISAATLLFDPDYEHRPPLTAKSMPNMEPLPTPSIVASSDVLGPEQTPDFNLSELRLNEFYLRDPQENVRQYLNLQHLSKIRPVDQAKFKPKSRSSPEEVDSPDSTRTTASLAEHLRTLPKLTIPVNQLNMIAGTHSANLSAQRTVTPSILRRQPNFGHVSIDATINNTNKQPLTYEEYSGSPSDFYRSHELYQQTSPCSEVDVPVTAIPACPIERLISQSVPPNMRFGRHIRVIDDPFDRPTSTKAENYRMLSSVTSPSIQILDRVDELEPLNDTIDYPLTAIPYHHIERGASQSAPPFMDFENNLSPMVDPIPRPTSSQPRNRHKEHSSIGSSIQMLGRVDEVVQPIDTIEDLNTTPRVDARSPGAITHTGWMKKRKTTRMLRHEWEPHHFKLKGTQLAMYEDEEASRRDSKALEYIDVDDYAVACSSLTSSSKLTAAFKKTVLKRKNSAQDETAFAFSLLPASNGSFSAIERKSFFINNGKTHHFAVQTRNERIDWMRELMLAKALKREKDNGNSVHVNGNIF
jgi:SAM domain (Sterile alpha motif)/PH domain